MSIKIDPDSNQAIINNQRQWLQILQGLNPKKPIRVKILEGGTPPGEDSELYQWSPYVNIWHKVKQPIFTRGILPNEILIDPDTPDWQAMKEGIEKLSLYCKGNNIPLILGFSGGKGIHASIFYGNIPLEKQLIDEINQTDIDVYKTARRALIIALAEKAGVDLESICVDWGKINFSVGRKGSQIRTFGTTRAPGLYKTLIEKIPDHKPEPYELPLVFPENVELWEIENTEYEEIVLHALIKEVERAKKANEHSITDADFTGTEIRKFPCVEKLFEAKLTSGRYYAGISVLLMCEKCGNAKEEAEMHIRRLFKTFPGITQAETDLRINNALTMYGRGYYFSCRELKETFGEEFCDFPRCPIKAKIEAEREEFLKVNRFGIPLEFEGLYKIFLTDDEQIKKINLIHEAIADKIIHNLNTISFKDSIFVYRDGIYVEGEAEVNAEIARIIRGIKTLKPDYQININSAAKEILYYIKYKNPFFEYPFNQCENLLPVKNGVLRFDFDEEKVDLIQYDPKYLFTFKLPVVYDPQADPTPICNVIKGYVGQEEREEESSSGKIVKTLYSDIDLLYQIPAQAILQLTGSNTFKKAYLLQGDANAGKSTYLELLAALLGRENISNVSLQTMLNDRFALADLEGKILNCYDDLAEIPLNEGGMFKTVTGGYRQRIQRKGKQAYDADLKAVHVFTCNTAPEFSEKLKRDTAFWERWEFINFFNVFEVDPFFKAQTFTEENISGFLNGVLQRVFEIKKKGRLLVDSTVAEVREKWQFNADPLYRFIDALFNPESKNVMYLDKEALLKLYERYCIDKGVDPGKIPKSVTGFTQLLYKYDIVDDQKTLVDKGRTKVYRVPYSWKEKGVYYIKPLVLRTEQEKLIYT